ncbi:hypothetical protein VOLCADRAFT_106398 [Volvox carteri f. nagariensis]|uniref:Uncharacterized protein n=1 Tax=Volvox carteri f. nagariensis TaxID=3068 RepID=D8U748_VOLCA|nr:uncharacterized protein VOLCADRAFT_106398 [Volvox carteri f. nagariensis]EFJ44362.1 hypothetical protein VOLCADRAFT_106398 [Volvox carteri f. nagariensis]|eukprot:XP_002954469.1 hypothetical protein VOLCADRAFT_106398 [Volvox carteri f. nagariensis]
MQQENRPLQHSLLSCKGSMYSCRSNHYSRGMRRHSFHKTPSKHRLQRHHETPSPQETDTGQRITDEQLDVMRLAQASTLIAALTSKRNNGGHKTNSKINHYDDNLQGKGGGPSQNGAGGASAAANASQTA